MKRISSMSLRMRITCLAGSILVLSSVLLTVTASYNANEQFSVLGNPVISPADLNKIEMDKIDMVDMPIIDVSPETPAFTIAQKKFNTQSMIVLFIVCVLGTFMVYIVAGKSLQPIQSLSKRISAISEKDLHIRIDEDERNDEVAVLRRSFNVMLSRLEDSFTRQKRFSANVAHELKTPLTIISTKIQVLQMEDNLSEKDYEGVFATTEKNVNRLISIVDDMLTLCDEREVIKTDEIKLKDMIDSISGELEVLIDEKGIIIHNNCTTQIIHGNSRLLYRAFYNLMENAIKYNRPNGIISIDQSIENNSGVIKITDTGYGIPEEEIQLIFEPFFRINKSRSRKLGGAGLGLSIVKMILDNHGWQISADSTVDVGSTFTICYNSNATSCHTLRH